MSANDSNAARRWIFGIVVVAVIAAAVYAIYVYQRQHQHLSPAAIRRDQRTDMRR